MSDPIETPIRAYVQDFQGPMSRSTEVLETAFAKRIREEVGCAEVARKVAQLHPGFERMRVLELGSGTGGTSVAMALLGAEVDGVEPSPDGVEASRIRAARYPGARVRFHAGAGEGLPFGDETFDLAVSFAVFEHVQDQARVLREAFRVLKRGGRIHFEMPNYVFPREEHYRIFYPPLCPKPIGKLYVRLRGKNPAFLDTLTYTTPQRVERKCRAAGFAEVEDLFRARSLARIEDPSLIANPGIARWIGRLSRWGLGGLLRFAIGRLRLYPEVHLSARRP